MMEYLGSGGSVVNSPNVAKGIPTLTINIKYNSYIENLKIEHYKYYKHLMSFKKNTRKHNKQLQKTDKEKTNENLQN